MTDRIADAVVEAVAVEIEAASGDGLVGAKVVVVGEEFGLVCAKVVVAGEEVGFVCAKVAIVGEEVALAAAVVSVEPVALGT